MPKLLFYILLVCLSSQIVTAQRVNDSAVDDSMAIDIYYQALGEQSPLYNGSEYLEYSYKLQEGHPFFASSTWTKGSIRFDGLLFRNVPMLYDIIKDELIIPDFQNLYKINLPADKVESFELAGHTFIRLVRDSLNGIPTGFYELLHAGAVSLLAKRQKKIIEAYADVRINNIVVTQNTYYIRKGGIYFLIRRNRDLLSVLTDKKREIQQYLKKSGVKFKHDQENAMLKAVEYYNR